MRYSDRVDECALAESFVKVGIVPGDGGCWLLPRVIGASHAAEMALTGDAIDAHEAQRIGLVSRVVPPEALMDTALALAQRVAANLPQVLRWTKQLLQHGRTGTLDDALDSAAKLQGLAHHTADHAEAVAAFLEKAGTGLRQARPLHKESSNDRSPSGGTPSAGVTLLRLNRPEALNALNLGFAPGIGRGLRPAGCRPGRQGDHPGRKRAAFAPAPTFVNMRMHRHPTSSVGTWTGCGARSVAAASP